MNTSLTIAKIAGIPIQIHWTFWFLLLWAAGEGYRWTQTWSGVLLAITAVLLLFSGVVLHELGHALAAKYFQIATRAIVLFPFGGVAQIQTMIQTGRTEFLIALAGPVVNLVIALVAGLVFILIGGWTFIPGILYHPEVIFPWLTTSILGDEPFIALVIYIFATNLSLALFNLLPAFPMDGGRILRALLSTSLPFRQSTRIAARTGQFLSIVFLGLMVMPQFNLQSPSTILVAVLVFLGATYEDRLVQRRWQLNDLRVADVKFSRALTPVLPEQSLGDVVKLILKSPQWDIPVMGEGGMVGLLKRDDMLRIMQTGQTSRPVSSLMRTDYPIALLEDDLQTVRQRMIVSKFTTLPVFDGKSLIGLINVRDIRDIDDTSRTDHIKKVNGET